MEYKLLMIISLFLIIFTIKRNRAQQKRITDFEQNINENTQLLEKLDCLQVGLEEIYNEIDFFMETKHLRTPIKGKKKRLRKKEEKRQSKLNDLRLKRDTRT